MRRWSIAAAVGVLALALASAALAQFSQTSKVTLTAHKAGQSTGIKADIYSSDPTAPGGKPKGATEVLISLPVNTRFNLATKLIKPCTLTTKRLESPGGPTCPRSSQIGTGSAVANASPLTGLSKINGSVTAYVRNSSTIILVVSTTIATPEVIVATVSGARLTISVPVEREAGISIVLTLLKLNVPALGSGGDALITAGKCVAHSFTAKSHFVYTDHSTLDLNSSSPCS
jgi:hypothetical protein